MQKYRVKEQNSVEEVKSHRRHPIKRTGRTRTIKRSDTSKLVSLGGANKDMLTTVNSKSTIDKTEIKGLTPQKKELFKNMIGKYSTKIDMNKVREEYKR